MAEEEAVTGWAVPAWAKRRPRCMRGLPNAPSIMQSGPPAAASGAADSAGPALTPAQRRLLVAAGAGIPARLLSSRPSRQAAALAQQPLRGAWRAGATYRPALRAAATAALTAAEPDPSPLDNTDAWAGADVREGYKNMYGWLVHQARAAHVAERKGGKDEGSKKERSKGRKPARGRGREPQALPRGAADDGGDSDDSFRGTEEINSDHEAEFGGLLGVSMLHSWTDCGRKELRMLKCGHDMFRMHENNALFLAWLLSCSAAQDPNDAATAELKAEWARDRIAWRVSVVEGAYVALPDPRDTAALHQLSDYLRFPRSPYTNYPYRVMLGRALLQLQLGCQVLSPTGVHIATHTLAVRQRRVQYDLDALVDHLVQFLDHGGLRVTLPELRLLTFMLGELHVLAAGYDSHDLMGAGPRLGPVPAHLTSMGVLIRIVRYAAERFMAIPQPPALAAAIAADAAGTAAPQADSFGFDAHDEYAVVKTGGHMPLGAAAAALAAAPVRWPEAEAVMSEVELAQLARMIIRAHWYSAIAPAVEAAVREAVEAGSDVSRAPLDDVAGALSSPDSRGGRAYATAVQRACSKMGLDSSMIRPLEAERVRKAYEDTAGDAVTCLVAGAEWDDAEREQAKVLLRELERWLPEAVLQPLPAAPAKEADEEAEAAVGDPPVLAEAPAGVVEAGAEGLAAAASCSGAAAQGELGSPRVSGAAAAAGQAAAAVGAAGARRSPPAPVLRSGELGRLGPRMHLARMLVSAWSDAPRSAPTKLTAVGSAAAALAVGAAAAANALRDWLGTVLAPVAVDNPTRTGVLQPLSRQPAPAPWLTLASGPSGANGSGSGGAGRSPFAWLRSDSSDMAMGLSLGCQGGWAGAEDAEVEIKLVYGTEGLARAAHKALDAATRRSPQPISAGAFALVGLTTEGGRMANLTAALAAALVRDGAAVLAVGGGGVGRNSFLGEAQTRVLRDAGAKQLEDAVAAIMAVQAQRPQERLALLAVPYGGLGAVSSVRHACKLMADEMMVPVPEEDTKPAPDKKTPRAKARKPKPASALDLLAGVAAGPSTDAQDRTGADAQGEPSAPEVTFCDGASMLTSDSDGDGSGPRRMLKNVHIMGNDFDMNGFMRNLKRTGDSNKKGPRLVWLRKHWGQQYQVALLRATCAMLGVTPLPSRTHDALPWQVQRAAAARKQDKGWAAASEEEKVRSMLRRRVEAVLDVGELAAAGLALVVVGAERLKEAKAEDEAEKEAKAAEAEKQAEAEEEKEAKEEANSTARAGGRV
ncbi:hypothetical protein HYH03_009714 [Edaphochlamys debaryana]|uniref:Uncharacterized protein n=1 Tax=Edaphochlamys debaryana TaxID=47281 RepID=A0A836BY68_9CHLO|nr:hypothetical protein HYH03_009714 [Edaphochlamys debaryana]|eukprot:KAG2491983.1 hypothetical protein HYH03_009714 [Edaphochlamys debaryana]